MMDRSLGAGTALPAYTVRINRVVGAARLYLISGGLLISPWAVLASAFVINLAVFWAIRARGVEVDQPFTGALASLYFTAALVFVSAMNKYLSFALGFGLSRRVFFLGTVVFALAGSLACALVLILLRALESATDGWGIGLPFFSLNLDAGNPGANFLAYAAVMLAVCSVGAFGGSISARWGMTGIYVASVLALAASGLFAVLMTYAGAWTALGHWFQDQPTAALFAGYPWLIALLFGGGSYLVVRRVGA